MKKIKGISSEDIDNLYKCLQQNNQCIATPKQDMQVVTEKVILLKPHEVMPQEKIAEARNKIIEQLRDNVAIIPNCFDYEVIEQNKIIFK